MKKLTVAMSIAVLVVSMGASLALAAPLAPSAPRGMMSWPTGEDPSGPIGAPGTGPMMTMDQMQTRMQTQQVSGMMTNNAQVMPCMQNSSPSK